MRDQARGPDQPEYPTERPRPRERLRPVVPIAFLVALFVVWAGVALALWLILAES